MPPADPQRRRVVRKAKPKQGVFGGVQKVGKQAFKPKPPPSLGGRALHDVAATAQAVSKGKKPPKPTVKRAPHKVTDTFKGPVLKAKTEGGSGRLASINAAASIAVPALAAADAVSGGKGLKTALKAAKNVPIDAADIAVGTPAALYHVGAHPKDIPKMLVQPYKELAKDPVGFVTEHPVMAALLAEPVRLPGRAAGAGLRVAGKQTLERAPATLPGTSLTVTRVKSRDAVVNALQTSRDKAHTSPVRQRFKDVEPNLPKGTYATTGRYHPRSTPEHQGHRFSAEILALKKGHGDASAAGSRLARHAEAQFGGFDAVAAVPSSSASQAALASAAANELGASTVRAVGTSAKNYRSLDARGRAAAAKAMAVKISGNVRGKRVLVVDDVLVTGEQAKAVAAALTRAGARDVRVAALAKAPVREARQTLGPTISDKPGAHVANKGIRPTELERRVDEFYGGAQKHKIRVRNAATKSAEQRGYTPEKAAEHVSGASVGAGRVIDRRLAQEFGSTWTVDPKTKAILKNPTAEKGALHPTKEAAQRVADAINKRGLFNAVVREAGKHSFGVVPETVARRIGHHGGVGRSPAVGSIVMRESRRAFGRSVLPFSKNFLAGQAGEAAYRSVATGSGPTSYLRGRLTLKRQAQLDPQAAKQFRDRTVGDKSTQTGHAGHAAEYMGGPQTLAGAFDVHGMPVSLVKATRGVTKAGKAPVVKQARGAFHAWSNVVFKHVNATIERHAQTAMLGKALKQSPLGERHVLGLTSKAIDDYARGLTKTENQVAAARELHRMYGKYKDFSPAMREALMHTTPFLPWYINTARFVARLPVDHPLHAALVADIDAASEEWRKAHGYSLRGGEKIPDFLTGGPLGRWLPYPPRDVSGSVGGLVLPQFEPTAATLVQGVDWKGKPIKGSKAANAALSQVESLVPGVAQVDRVTGVGDTRVRHTKDATDVFNGKTLSELKRDLVKQVDVTASFKTKTGKQAPTVSSGRPILKAPTVRLKKRPILKSSRPVLK